MTGAVDRSGPVAAAPLAPEGPARATRPGASTWLITFTDLAALMLALFVMLFSMSTMDEAKWRRVAAALSPDGDRRSEDAAPAASAARYASNWDLSLRRALAVRSALERAGYSRPVVARGYGASRFEALSPRLDPRRRYALARRVDIVIHEAGNSRS